MCLMGEWWINAATNRPVVRDQIHAVVGQLSLFVATSESSALTLMMETPCRGVLLGFVRDCESGGLTACSVSA